MHGNKLLSEDFYLPAAVDSSLQLIKLQEYENMDIKNFQDQISPFSF